MSGKENNSGLRVVTQRVRLSFPHLFEVYSIDGEQEPKFSVMILIPKTDEVTMKALRRAEALAAEAGKMTKFGGRIPKDLASIIKDGDEDGSAEDYPERAGHFYMTVSSNASYRPGVVDRNVTPILDQTEVYSGVYARVSVTAFPYKFGNTKKGVSFGLNNVQILGGGASLGGRKRAEEEFDSFESDDDDIDPLL